jgi:ABC-2 type transport system permease protein
MADQAVATRAPHATEREPTRWGSQAWRQYRLERRMFWRNPTAAFFNFFLPLLFLAMFGSIYAGDQDNLDVIVPGIAGMSVMSTTFTAIAMNLTYLRDLGILKRIRSTPMPPSAYLAAVAGNAATNTVLQVAIITAAGAVVFDTGWPRDWAALTLFVVVGGATFAALGVALSHAIPNFESAPAFVNAVFLPLIMISGVFYDADGAPAVLESLAEVLPLKHLVDGLSGAMVQDVGIASNATALVVLVSWGIAGAVLAVRGFSWDARRA